MKRLDEPVELIIKTKCPKKWKILDTETGQSYEATGKTKLYEMWKPCKDIIKVEQKIDNLEKKLDKHIEDIWTVYKPIKKILEKLERFKLW
tara:strand:- start:198 stop:470 length:273 start_codon:yes stop_codon:yes gene_type:complete